MLLQRYKATKRSRFSNIDSWLKESIEIQGRSGRSFKRDCPTVIIFKDEWNAKAFSKIFWSFSRPIGQFLQNVIDRPYVQKYQQTIIKMNQLNRQLALLLERYEGQQPILIQELFNLLFLQPKEEKKVIQTAILYTMESIHEWENVFHYCEKWNQEAFRKELILRMKMRVDEGNSEPYPNTKEELRRLIDKYWLTHSPKVEEHKYRENNTLKQLEKKIESFSNQPSRQPSQVQIPERKVVASSNPENIPEAANSSGLISSDPYSSLTGRPAILKKGSLFDPIKKGKKDEFVKEQSKPMEIEEKRIPNANSLLQVDKHLAKQKTDKEGSVTLRVMPKSQLTEKDQKKSKNVIQMLAQFCSNAGNSTAARKRTTDLGQLRSESNNELQQPVEEKTQNQLTTSEANSSSHAPLADEPYPSTDQFYFGSVKKSKDAEIKKLTISPNKKLEVSNKVIKLRRTETAQPQPAEYESFFKNDFSFMKETFQPLEKSLIVDEVKPYPKITGSQDHRRQPKAKQERKSNDIQNFTPVFMGESESKSKVQFLTKEELSMVGNIKPKHLLKNYLQEKGVSMMSVFKEHLKKIKT